MSEKKSVFIKVFLLDFRDARAPIGYEKGFVNDLLFSSNPPTHSPAPDHTKFSGSAYQYFLASSDFWFSLKGNVTEWATSSLNIRDVPHYIPNGKMEKPKNTTEKTDYGETISVVIAETLRGLGYTSNNYHSKTELQKAILSLPNGHQADQMIFLNIDIGSGGKKTSFSSAKENLDAMSHERVKTNKISNGHELTGMPWNALWDSGWDGLPDFLNTPIIVSKSYVGKQNSDGTYTKSPASNTLGLAPLSVMWHELSHLAIGSPDLYSRYYTSNFNNSAWYKYCLMGESVPTHFPPPLSSYARYCAGWMEYHKYSRENHCILLPPFETHNYAIQVVNGAPSTQHYICLSNRKNLIYQSDWGKAPVTPNNSQQCGIYIYRRDPLKRLRGRDSYRKKTSEIRKDKDNVLWLSNEIITSLPRLIFHSSNTLRNERGELWWTLDKNEENNSNLAVELTQQALHLLESYHQAIWTGESPDEEPVILEPDRFSGAVGHVALLDKRMAVQGKTGRALYLHPRWGKGGAIRGIYKLNKLQAGAKRLYIKSGMPDEAIASDGVKVLITCGADKYQISLKGGQRKEHVLDFRDHSEELTILIKSNDSVYRDWVYIIDAWLVSVAPRIYDFLVNASEAQWKTRKKKLIINQVEADNTIGEVGLHSWVTLHTNKTYGPKVLFSRPDQNKKGWVEGVYSNIKIPESGGILRAHLGWASSDIMNSDRVTITIKITFDFNTITLLDSTKYTGEDKFLFLTELPLPEISWGKEVHFIFRIDADNEAVQQQLVWTEIALTSA